MSYQHFLTLPILLCLSVFGNAQATESPQTFTFDGRAYSDSAASTPMRDLITTKIQILNPDQDCVLYEETQSVNTTSSNGYFTIQIGSLPSAPKRSANDSNHSMSHVFSNAAVITGKLLSNGAACSYTPVAADKRYVRIQMTPAGDGVTRTISPNVAIDSVPSAFVAERAETLQGLAPANILQTNTSGSYVLSQTNLESLFTATNFSRLGTLLNVPPTNYVQTGSNGSATLPSVVGNPSSGLTAGQIWYDSGAQALKYYDGTVKIVGTSGGSVTSVATGTGLTGGPITSSGTISVDVGTTTGKILQVAASNKLPAIDASNLTNLTATNIVGAVTIANGGTGQTTKASAFDALAPTSTKGDLVLSNGSGSVRLPVGANNSFLQADSTQPTGVKWAPVTDTLSGLSCSTADVPTWNGSAWVCKSASALNTASNLVLRDATGSFAANQATLKSLSVSNGAGAKVDVLPASSLSSSWQLRLPTSEGTAGKFLKTINSSGDTTWDSLTTAPGGSTGQIQFNSASTLAGDSNLNWDNTNKRLGVGLATPSASLEVAGNIKVGNSSATCTATTKGSIRYNSTTNVLQFCDGSSWNLVQAAACTDPNPNAFTPQNLAEAIPSTLYTSDVFQITGIDCAVPVTISGDGSPEYRICTGIACGTVVQNWTSAPSTISNNQYLQVRLTTGTGATTTTVANINIGNRYGVFKVTNTGGDCTAGDPPIGTLCADGTVYAGMSPDGNVKMYTTPCDAGQTWNGSTCTGTRTTFAWNDGTGNWIGTNFKSALNGQTNSAGLIALHNSGSLHLAANYCESLNTGGVTGWYLPAIHELSTFYNSRTEIRNFDLSVAAWYWSSTDDGYSKAYAKKLNDGFQTTVPKNTLYYVRCAKK